MPTVTDVLSALIRLFLQACGQFSCVSDLMKIVGIGPALLEQNIAHLWCSTTPSCSGSR